MSVMNKNKWVSVVLFILGSIVFSNPSIADNGTWYDAEVKYKRTIVVNNENPGGFETIAEAYASISLTTPDKPILLKIMPGNYDIGELVFDKDYVDIQGSGEGNTVLNARVPDYGDFQAIYQLGIARMSDFTVDLNFGPGRADAGNVIGISTYSYKGSPIILNNLSVTTHFQNNVSWPSRLNVTGLKAWANNMVQYSLDAHNISVNLNLPEAYIDGYGVHTYGRVTISDLDVVITGGATHYGLTLGWSNSSYIANANVYGMFMPLGTNSFTVTNSLFSNVSGTALLANSGAKGDVIDSVIDGRIYDPLDRDSTVDVGVVLTNCVNGNGEPIIFPYSYR